jgi:hypothetical protein
VLGQALLEQKQGGGGRGADRQRRPRALQGAASADPEAWPRSSSCGARRSVKQFTEVQDVERKAPYVQRLQQAYTSAAQMGSESAIAGMFRLGQAIEHARRTR